VGYEVDKLKELGKDISTGFLDSGHDMTEQLVKVSGDNSLTPTMMQRVAEQANVHTYARLHETQADKTFTFPVCDCARAVQSINSGVKLSHTGKSHDIPLRSSVPLRKVAESRKDSDAETELTPRTMAKIAGLMDDRISKIRGARMQYEGEVQRTCQEWVKEGADIMHEHHIPAGKMEAALKEIFPKRAEYISALLPELTKRARDIGATAQEGSNGFLKDGHPWFRSFSKISVLSDRIRDIVQEEGAIEMTKKALRANVKKERVGLTSA